MSKHLETTGGNGPRPIPPRPRPVEIMKSFLNACGVKDALRLIVAGPGSGDGEPWSLPQPFAVIGRDPRTDVILDDAQVSRRHVYVQVVGGQAFWIDLESRTGTRTEAGPRKSGWLAGAGILEIGPFLIRRLAGAAAVGDPGSRESTRESPLEARGYGREALPEVTLEFLNGPAQSTRWPMRRVMSLIGSASGCKFRLTDPSVSAFHASLLRTSAGLWIVDLRGARSISINAEPVRCGPLSDGDVLGIGRYRIRVRCRESRVGAHDAAREASAGLPARQDRGGVARRPSPEQAATPPAFGLMLPMPPPPFPVVAPTTGVEVMSSDLAVPGGFQGQVSESVLVPLVNQFSMMQQQMFDQFQQAMGMLVQMFGTMHREQMDVIREELDRLHELSRELQELKNELARSPGRPVPTPDSPTAAPPAMPAAAAPVPPTAPVAAPPPPADRRPFPAPPIPSAPAGKPPGAGRGTPGNGSSAEIPIPAPGAGATGPRRPINPGVASPPPPSAPRPDQPRPGVGSPSTVGAPGPAGSEQDAVAWIHQRIMTIQHERESRWQKILKLLPGVS
jgi:pSer/pThr/pTyr-binding forkhead associated (FHA) protein/polyhydroxyalkanoate synthesis regulator phasin